MVLLLGYGLRTDRPAPTSAVEEAGDDGDEGDEEGMPPSLLALLLLWAALSCLGRGAVGVAVGEDSAEALLPAGAGAVRVGAAGAATTAAAASALLLDDTRGDSSTGASHEKSNRLGLPVRGLMGRGGLAVGLAAVAAVDADVAVVAGAALVAVAAALFFLALCCCCCVVVLSASSTTTAADTS